MSDLADGESIEVKGSGAKPYVLKNVGGVYSCTCPAWRNQSIPIETRTCKHLRKLRGDEAETARVGSAAPPRARSTDETAEKDGPPILLAHSWDNAQDLTNWWISEKLDGVRAYWDGERFISRQGNQYHAPQWFTEGLPNSPLDGELWIDRKKFQRTVSIVRRQDKSDHWKEVRFVVFDAPQLATGFEERLNFLKETLRADQLPYTLVLDHVRCTGLEHLKQELARVESLDGEGLMLRQPGSTYEIGRSMTLLKVKTFHDAEATVVAHQAGRGKHEGRLGALVAQLPDGTEFSIGTGFSDAERSSPPPVGSIVTFRYQELSDGGVPRFPSYVRLSSLGDARIDVSAPEKSAKSTKKAEPCTKPTVTACSSGSTTRYFELVDDSSNKFWEITIDGSSTTVRYGRIGASGTSKSTDYSDSSSANSAANKLIDEKVKKGYVENSRSH